jgi:hypothetical protein
MAQPIVSAEVLEALVVQERKRLIQSRIVQG